MTLTWAFHIDSIEFTPGVIAGAESLGGSESACLGLARALAARGHRVYIFTPRLHRGAPSVDAAGVRWHHTREIAVLSMFIDWDVFVALRLPQVFDLGIQAAYRILWNQDLMTGEAAKLQTMALAWAYDAVVYVSQYHRKQWEGVIPELAPIGWVTKNGYDPAHVPASAVKHPHRVIHITRPERGLRPLLAMWPELRRRVPDAELHLCRYNSMYDASGWGRVCEAYDEQVARVNDEVGGITFLGELGKPALYQAIAESAVMWYPGVADFAETSCVAAIEAQACGTPFVGSYKGALPETVPGGLLIAGDADTAEYQARSIAAVVAILNGQGVPAMVERGRQHVAAYTYATIAAEWEAYVVGQFEQRVTAHGPRVLDRLLHEDDHVAAQVLARELGDGETAAYCQYVIDGKDQGPEHYAERAMDPRVEMQSSARLREVVRSFDGAGCESLLDLACGNGAFALALAQAHLEMRVVGVDYSQGNVDVATRVAAELGLSDRVTFLCGAVYDFDTHQPETALLEAVASEHGPFYGVFVGEFLEHIANVSGFLSSVHAVAAADARIVCTMPSGPFGELAHREMPIRKGHVHHYRPDDLEAIFGAQGELDVSFLDGGGTPRGSSFGHWIVRYRVNGAAVGERPLAKRILTTRPMAKLSVGLICNDTTDLRRCLESVWQIADEIVIGDTGAGPELAAEAARYPRTRVIPVGAVPDLPGGFSEARNRVLDACEGEWFLWIDSDERLMRGDRLHRYLDAAVFNGYGIRQKHLMLDTPNTFDTPIRVFRRVPAVRFYGCIHEQPQQGDCNGDIVPSLQLEDVEIAHTGYLNDGIRRDKALQRNLPLLVRDREQFPDRTLGILLVQRDALNLGILAMEAAGWKLTPDAKKHFGQVIALFEQHFADQSHKYHALGRPFYEAAVQRVAGAIEVEVAFAAGMHGLKAGRAQSERFWVRTPEQLPSALEAKQREWLKPMQPEPPIDVEPIAVTDQTDTVYDVEGVAV